MPAKRFVFDGDPMQALAGLPAQQNDDQNDDENEDDRADTDIHALGLPRECNSYSLRVSRRDANRVVGKLCFAMTRLLAKPEATWIVFAGSEIASLWRLEDETDGASSDGVRRRRDPV